MSLVKLSVIIHNAYRKGVDYTWMVQQVKLAAPHWRDPSELPAALALVDEVYGVPPVPHRGSRA